MNPKDHEKKIEGGYVIVTTALLIIPLVLFAALVVDVGSWLTEGRETQRAADAGALSGVVWLPDESKAAAVALETVQLNGYPNAVLAGSQSDYESASVDVNPIVLVETLPSQELRVSVKAPGKVYFGSVVGLQDIAVSRPGTADVLLPIYMGNPDNTLGNGVDSPDPDNYWLALVSPSSARNFGDIIGPTTGVGGANPNHDPNGHLYAVDVPAGSSDQFLQVRSTCFKGNSATADISLYAPDDTDFSDTDNITPTNRVASDSINRGDNPGACNWSKTNDSAVWQTVHNVGQTPGRWIFQAKHSGAGSGRVLYSLRVVDSAGLSCQASPTCPTLSSINWLTTFTTDAMFSVASGSNVDLYITEIGPKHAGKTLELLLFDPAEGIQSIKVKDQNDQFVDFTWDTIDIDEFGYGPNSFYTSDAGPFDQKCDGDSAVTSPLNPCDPTFVQGKWFQDRTVRVQVPISEIPCTGPSCWWKLTYITSETGKVTETASYKARILGGPVRLTE